MFTGGTIWILTHGQMSPSKSTKARCAVRPLGARGAAGRRAEGIQGPAAHGKGGGWLDAEGMVH